MSCIFCRGPVDRAAVEHILPESLGGKEWACLPPGVVCAKCNQYFGSKVEPLALGSFPFLPFRLLLGIPTKRNRSPKMQTHLGTIRARSSSEFEIDPTSFNVAEAIEQGKITRLTILAEPTEPLAVCRLLLKMGLEVIASDSPKTALSSRFDAARMFARAPSRNSRWWFLLCVNHDKLFANFLRGVSLLEWIEGVSLEVIEFTEAPDARESGTSEVFHLKLLDMDLITPLVENVMPPAADDLQEPEYRLFRATC